MTERPILFSGPMVRALLAGTKTQTRRIMKTQLVYGPVAGLFNSWYLPSGDGGGTLYPNGKDKILATCPYGQPGDRLWVRETFVQGWPLNEYGYVDQFNADDEENPKQTFYRASSPDLHWCEGADDCRVSVPWKPSIHMPRAASRILLEITEVRVERLQAVSEADAAAEGVATDPACPAYDAFAALWNQINGEGAWASNPWVWAVSFKRVEP